MKFKYSLIILSIFLISLVFIASASAADVNKTTEVLSIDESTNIENNNTLTLDSSSKISAVSNDNNKENLQVPNSDTWYVNATSNPGGDGKSKDTAFTSLKEAIDSATDGDTVYIASGTYTGENNTNLTFSKNLNFIKYGDDEVTFNAQGLSRIWNVSATSINISGLTFRNGKSENGSAIYFAKIINFDITAKFINNTAENGGAIYIKDGNLSGNLNAIFMDNTAKFSGGAIYIDFGDVSGNITGSYINNTAKNGGAIYIREGNISGNLAASFINNTAEDSAGAVYIYYGWVSGNITGSYINNTAASGGAIVIGEGVSGNVNASFINNMAKDNGGAIIIWKGGISGNFASTFINNKAKDYGGAIYIWNDGISGNLGGTFINNKAKDYGGAVCINGGGISGNITGSYINNAAEDAGGAIYIWNEGISGNINASFMDNTANFGGAIYIEEGDISGNINGTFVHNYAITGCAIYAEKGNVSGNLTGIFANNVDGGAIFINGDVSGNLDGIYINNTAWGGAVYISRNLSGNLNGTFINNTKGAVYIGRFLSGNLNGTFVNNQHAVYIMGGLYGNLTGSYINNTGGAIYINYGGISGNLTGSYINNTVNGSGGAIYINYGGISGNLGGTFINNTAEDDGGAIYIFNGGISGNLNATFINNKANYYGGAINIWNDGISGNLTGFYINNTARYGGAISLDYDVLGNVGGFYINNTADEGGAINIWDGSVLGNLSCSFINNKAKKGEAIYIDFDYDQNDYLTVIRDSIFINNNESTIYLRSFKIDIVICLENTTGNITVNSRDKTYNTTVVNGNATLTPPGLSVNVTSHSGDKKYTYTTVEIFVLQKSDVIIDAPDVIKYYGGPERFIAYLYDSKDNPIVNKSVNITINGVTYTRITDSDGIVSLALRLGNGTYYVTTTADDTTVKSMVTVLSTVIGYDITKYYKNATQYRVNVYDTYGDAVGKGEVVTFNINGIFYNRTTDENGIATLNINLPPGEYIITSDYKGCKVANNITVLPILNASDISMKYLDGTQFKVNLVDGQGNPYKNQFVRFNVNGIFYDRLTDKNGQAALNIRLPAGEYIITSSFNGANIANKITITA